MHRELRNGWSCRPERNLSGGQSGKRKKKTGVIKRGMAYFLTFLMLVGNVQTVAYAEESARNLAGSIHREETIGGSTTERAQGGTGFSSSAGTQGGTGFSSSVGAQEERSATSEREEASSSEIKTGKSSVTEGTGTTEEKKTEEKDEDKAEEKDSLPAGTFTESLPGVGTVTASFEEGTFPSGTTMKVEKVEENGVIEKAKDAILKKYQEKNPGFHPDIDIVTAVDITFYHEENGEEKEVQPKAGKKVDVRFQKTEKIEKVLSDGEKELQLVHLPEGLPVEILPLKEEKDDLLFSAKHFSPTVLAATPTAGLSADAHDFKAFWMEAPATSHDTGRWYTDGSNGDMRKQKKLNLVPQEYTSNAVITSTIGVELTLKGNKNTKYKPGTVTMDIPARIYKGWDSSDPNKIAVSSLKTINQYPLLPAISTGVPEAPGTNPQSSFNYTIVQKDLGGGKTAEYFRLKNFRELSGGVTFKADIVYNLTPSMLFVTPQVVNGKPKGVYDNHFPVTIQIDHEDNSLDAVDQKELSVHVETEVKPTTMELKHGEADVNKGVFFTWDNSWGDKPADADQYFYGVWYLRVDRARGSSQAFDYTFHTASLEDSDGGILVGAKKLPMNGGSDNYFYRNNIEIYAKNGYANIARYMGVGPNPNPPANAPYLANPVNRSYVGIPKDPSVAGLPTFQPYVEGTNYANSDYNSQLYALLYKYPYTKLKEARDAHINLSTVGIELKNKITFTEHWADGYTRNGEALLTDKMKVLVHPSSAGDFLNTKYNSGARQYYLGIFGTQSIYKDGNDGPLIYSNWYDSFTLSSSYQAKNSSVVLNSDGTYKTSSNPAVPGSGVTITDRSYYLYRTTTRSVDGQTLPDTQNIAVSDVDRLQHGQGNDGDVYRGTPYKLSDDDYHYRRIYMKDMKAYDVEKVNNEIIGFAKKAEAKKEYTEYPPVEVWLRKKGKSSFFHYGSFTLNRYRQYIFTPVAGYQKKATINDNLPISASNQLDLEKAFENDSPIVGLQLRQDSNLYRTSFDAAFTLQITPTPQMQTEIAGAMTSNDNYKISFLAGAADAEVRQEGNIVLPNYRIGNYLAQVGYGLEPLNINSELLKQNKPYVDHPERSEQTMEVTARGSNAGTFPTAFQEDKYTKKYQINEGKIYDLLPAGTYVDENSIVLGTWDQQDELPANRLYEKGRDYTVTFKKNWEQSGQTMMLIEFKAPNDAEHRFWNKSYNRSGWKLRYTLSNPYTNIVDRGRNVVNTLGFVNTNPNSIWNGNYTDNKTPNVDKILQYQSIKDTEKVKPNHTISVTQLSMPFGPVTVLEAAFTNTVSTEIDPRYMVHNVSYMGDPYTHRLLYQSSTTTRSTDLILFDILGKDEDRNGDFNGVDIDSMLSKRSYDKTNSANTDTLLPRVFYATQVPTPEQLDLGKPLYDPGHGSDSNPNKPGNPGSIWHLWNYQDESANTVDRKTIKALAFDLRTTVHNKPFILDQQGVIVANVNMLASTKQSKVSVENTNVAYRKGILFPGQDVPQNVAADVVQSSSTHRLVEPVVFHLPVKKILEVPAGLTAPNIKEKFTFTISDVDGSPLLDEEGNPVTAVKKNPDIDGGTVDFGKIRLLKPGTYKYKVHESGVQLGGIRSLDMGDKFLTVTVTDPDHVKMRSDLRYSDQNPLTFTNVYNAGPVEPEIKVAKFLSATAGIKKPDITNAFEFTLKRASANDPMPAEAGTADSLTKRNPSAIGGEVSFGRVKITRPGVYKYTITESGLFPGITNDPRPTREVTITVEDYGFGQLIALVSGDDFNYVNVFNPVPTEGAVSLGKAIRGNKPATADPFRFVLRTDKMEIDSNSVYWEKDTEDPSFADLENGVLEGELASSSNLDRLAENKPTLKMMPRGFFQPMPAGSSSETETVIILGEGHTSYNPIVFHIPGVYTYTLEELNDKIPNYVYDPTVYKVVFTVTQDKDNKRDLHVKQKIYKNGVEVSEALFTNEYRPNSPGGGGGDPKKPIPYDPGAPGGPGVKPKEPDKPITPETPEQPTPGGEIPRIPRVPKTIKEIRKRMGEILGESRKRPLTPEEEKELKHLGEVLAALRRARSHVRTADSSSMLWYALASMMSFALLSFYYLLESRKKKH